MFLVPSQPQKTMLEKLKKMNAVFKNILKYYLYGLFLR